MYLPWEIYLIHLATVNETYICMEDISRFVSKTLDNIGYSADMIKDRRDLWHQHATIHLETDHHYGRYETSSVIAGSKGEGLSSYFENDVDHLQLPAEVISTNNVELFSTQRGMLVFYTDDTETPPGYTKLRLINKGHVGYYQLYEESLFRKESEVFASSSLYASWWNKCIRALYNQNTTVNELTGPATPIGREYCSKDHVIGLHCMYREILLSFRTRLREHDWPPLDILQDESSTLCQLVPVGCKGSCNQWMEWRFCFIETELNLTKSFNDIQTKVYIILKFISKDILKYVSKGISSFIMKNITYWMSHLLGSQVFKEENLMFLIMMSLNFLKSALDSFCLPYYVIPGRNLLSEKLDQQTAQKFSNLLSLLLQEGPQLVMRCAKLRDGCSAMLMSPLLLNQYRHSRDHLERLHMLRINVKLRKGHGCCTNNIGDELLEQMYDIVLPEREMLRGNGVVISSVFYERLVKYLS